MFLAAGAQVLGVAPSLKTPTSIKDVISRPTAYEGKTVRLDGIVTAVCQEMGCWMAVAESDAKDAPVLRLKVEHEGAIKFPMSAKGKKVSAEGVFQSIGGDDAHGKEAAHEHAKTDAKASTQFQITATGAVIR